MRQTSHNMKARIEPMKKPSHLFSTLMALVCLAGLSGCSERESTNAPPPGKIEQAKPAFPPAFHPPGWKHSLELDLGRCTREGGDLIKIAILSESEFGMDCSLSYPKGEQGHVVFVDQSGKARFVPLIDEDGIYRSKGVGGGFPIEFSVEGKMLLGKVPLTRDGRWAGEIIAKKPLNIKGLPASIAPGTGAVVCDGGTPEFIGLDGYYYYTTAIYYTNSEVSGRGAGVGDVICRYKAGGDVEYVAGTYLEPRSGWKYHCPDNATTEEACFYESGLVAAPNGVLYVTDRSLGDEEANVDADPADSSNPTRIRKIYKGMVTTVARIYDMDLLEVNRNSALIVVGRLRKNAAYQVIKFSPEGKILSEKPLPLNRFNLVAPSADGHVYVYAVTQTGPTKRRYDIARID